MKFVPRGSQFCRLAFIKWGSGQRLPCPHIRPGLLAWSPDGKDGCVDEDQANERPRFCPGRRWGELVSGELLDPNRSQVIMSTDGSYLPSGKRIAGSATSVDMLEDLIGWAHKGGVYLRGPRPRVWVIGAAVRPLAGSVEQDPEALCEGLGQALARLVNRGWELAGTGAGAYRLARGTGPARVDVEVLAERRNQPASGLAGSAALPHPTQRGRGAALVLRPGARPRGHRPSILVACLPAAKPTPNRPNPGVDVGCTTGPTARPGPQNRGPCQSRRSLRIPPRSALRVLARMVVR